MTRVPFAGLAHGEPDRPYPPVRLSIEQWKREPVKSVYLSDLHLTQSFVLISGLFGVRSADPNGDGYPHAVSWRGEIYLEDNHTLVVYQALAGTRTMRMRVHVVAEHDS